MDVHAHDLTLIELATPRHGAFLRRDANRAGVGDSALRHRLAAGLLSDPARGVLVHTAFPAGWRQDLAVATLAAPRAVISHRGALALHLPGLLDVPTAEVTVPPGGGCTAPGVVVHRSRLDPRDVTKLGAFPVTTLAVTLADLGAVDPSLLEPALDAARRKGVSLRWLRETAARRHRPGQAGTGLLLGLLEEIRPGDAVRDSWFEKLVEDVLRSPLLPPLVRQYTVRDAAGSFVARVDGAYPELKLGIEAHSRRFHFGSGPEAADELRDVRLAALGWDVLYLGWHRTRSDPDAILRRVFAAAVARGWDPSTGRVRSPKPQ